MSAVSAVLKKSIVVLASALVAMALLVVSPGIARADDTQLNSGAAANANLAAGTGQTVSTPVPAPTIEERLAKVNLSVRAKVQGKGWMPGVKMGKTAGTKGKKELRGLKLKLVNTNGVSGSIRYKVFKTGKKWATAKKNGAAATSGKNSISAVRIWLTGKVSKYYDVYYRVYIKEYGWLDWARNKQIAGTTSLDDHIGAVKVKLVKKGTKFKGKTTTRRLKTRWQALEFKYRDNDEVGQILEVKYKGGTKAQVVLRKKKGAKWKTALSCTGYVGYRGVGKTHEGLMRTPSGDYEITSAFGIKSDPGALLPYVHVNDAMYWCGDRSYYNQLIDINENPHYCTGEHLIDYSPHYDYGLFFDYNTNPIRYGAGSAFFVHCTGGSSYTAGCIAVSESNMKSIIRKVDSGARICIYRK